MTDIIWTDRSRIEAFEKCPRLRMLRYEYGGRGLEPDAHISWSLLTGRFVHAGIAAALAGKNNSVDDLLEQYRREVSPALDIAPDEGRAALEAELTEQLWLVEALVRGWQMVGLPRFQADFVVLAVERESPADFTVLGRTVRLMARPDVLARRRSDGVPFIVNFKTVSVPDMNWREQWRYDMQTFGEMLGVEQRLGETCGGTIIEGLVKGKRIEYPEGSGHWYHNSPLTHCWFRAGEPPLTEDTFATRYARPCTNDACKRQGEPHEHTLPKGFRKVPVAEKFPGGIAAWLDYLSEVDPELLAQQFLQLPPILRAEFEIEEWRDTVLAREVEIASRPADVKLFPRHTAHGNCLRPSKCPMFEICWGSAGSDPLGSGYHWRIPNHPEEEERWRTR